MGLRIAALEPAPPTREDWQRRVEDALVRASTNIAAGRISELRALATELAEWSDGQRAYQARCRLAEVASAATADAPERSWIPAYLAVAEILLDALAEHPAEPVLLNHAGILLYEVGEAGAAESLFRAAQRLDPELDHVRDNLDAARRRKQGPRARLQPPAAAQARALAARAARVASAARPADGLTLSLVMIVKDEEEMLPGCLDAVREAVDEMVVVDTGSTDRTVEIAESFGAKVVHFPWNGSFADARNVSLEHATGDWVVYLDADEHLVPEDAPVLRSLLGRTWREAFYLTETNYTGGDEAGSSVAHLALRMFRNRPEYRFEGRIHEQKTGAMPTYLGERFETTTIRVRHYGYLKSRVSAREKSKRNIELLLQEAKDAPSPFVEFNLGSEYIALGEWERASAHLQSSWTDLHRDANWHTRGYSPMLAARYAQAQREAGDPRSARATLEDALAVYPDHTELVLQASMCARDQGALAEAVTLAERCLALGDPPAKYSATVGSGTYLARCLLAEIRSAQGRPLDAEEQYRLALEEHPDYIAPVLPLAALQIARGAEVDETCVRVAAERPSAALLLATALYEGGCTAEAEAAFRAVLAQRPALGVARIGLVETLLAQKRYAEAAAEAALEPAGSPVSPAAAVAELFAHAAAGDAAALAAALAGAGARGAGAHELALYGAWHAALAGGRPPYLAPEAGLAALTALEALLRVLDFKPFEQLHGVLEHSALPARERREGLAQLYLRRGFLDSAADEWLAVARERPDARAYLGLAQVARAKGLVDDARTLAREALALEPGNRAAERLRDAA
ncbi:MAG TPA: glycosyltransferase [Gaiellaceae bacterium]|nr:glycosyltransferase [Gaiellaceae bacterium]